MERAESGDEAYVRINVDILGDTARALKVRCADNVQRWIPKSVIFGPDEKKASSGIGEMMGLKVMEWFVDKNSIPRAR